jgi:hypothetical protein
MPNSSLLQPRGRGGGTAPPPKPVSKPEPTVKAAPAKPKSPSRIGAFVPSLIRFLILVGGVVAVIYGAMYALATNVKVQPREMTEIVEIPKAEK